MSSAMYALEMLLLQTQLDVDAKILKGLKHCGYFVVYTKHWFKSPIGAEAAANNLQLRKLLLLLMNEYQYLDTSDAALSALKRHLWYLSEELILFALCSHQLQEHT